MTTLNINPSLISWAIDRAGLQFSTFTEKLKWLSKEKCSPTVKQLEDFSKKVHIPFGYFFLPTPPEINLPFPLFRTERNQRKYESLEICDTVAMLQQRQDWLKEYLIKLECEPLEFVGSAHNQTVEEVVASIRNTLNLTDNWASEYHTWQEALDELSKKIESIGIIITFNGVVGNNTHRQIKVEDCRGFVLSDDIAPFIFINNSDSKSAQMFTIAHELAHVWVGSSAGFDFRKLMPADDDNEIFCDQIAAELLVPKILFNNQWDNSKSFSDYAKYFKVSELVIARRALDTNKISKQEFFTFYDKYISNENIKKSDSGGGNFYATTKKRISLQFASYINNALQSGELLHRDAYRLTNLHGNTFHEFISRYL